MPAVGVSQAIQTIQTIHNIQAGKGKETARCEYLYNICRCEAGCNVYLKNYVLLWHSRWYWSAIYEGDDMRKETSVVSGSFGIQGSVAPAGGEELCPGCEESVMIFSCLFPGS